MRELSVFSSCHSGLLNHAYLSKGYFMFPTSSYVLIIYLIYLSKVKDSTYSHGYQVYKWAIFILPLKDCLILIDRI